MALTYSYLSGDNFVLRQILCSSKRESGHRVYFFSKPLETDLPMSDNLKSRMSKALERYPNERLVCVQLSAPSKSFANLEDDQNVLILYEPIYLNLLSFFKNEYPAVCEKLLADYRLLKDNEYLTLSETLSFRGPSIVHANKFLGKFDNSFYLNLTCQDGNIDAKIDNRLAVFGTKDFSLSIYALQILCNDIELINEKMKNKSRRIVK